MYAAVIIAVLFLTPHWGLCTASTDSIEESETGEATSIPSLPLYFIENQGQMDKEVLYYLKGSHKILYFCSDGITTSLIKEHGDREMRWVVKLDFVNPNPGVLPRGEDKQRAKISYFRGKPEKWKRGIPTYGKLVYPELWPGIDLVYHGAVNQLKYEFVVKPGADPNKILLSYQGASQVSIKEGGELEVITPLGSFEDQKPYAYQTIHGKTQEVALEYRMNPAGLENRFIYGFHLGAYDPGKPLILDPSMLVYSGYVGGEGIERCYGIAVDKEGCAYVTGYTTSTETSLPVKVGPDLTHNGDVDIFIAKVNAQGTDLVYCGYIGGDDGDGSFRMVVDEEGNAYITGNTFSSESSFPVKNGPDLTFNGYRDAFLVKVNAQGTDLLYSGYIGGMEDDGGYGLAVDSTGHAYVSGWTYSDETSFPIKIGPDLTHNGGGSDAYVAKVNPQGTGFEYCGYIGGSDQDTSFGLGIDAMGQAILIGMTDSNESSFPVKTGPDLLFNGANDAFVARVDAQGTHLVYCGYIGGINDDYGVGIAVNEGGNAFITGWTYSDEGSFPVKVGPDVTFNGGYGDAFVAKVNVQGTGLDYLGYIGGERLDFGVSIAIDSEDHAYVTGDTRSETDFPVLFGPDLTFNGAGIQYGDGFVAKINAQGTGFLYCGYFGGEIDDGGYDIAVDHEGNAYITGWTLSDEGSFPLKVGPDLTYNGGTLFGGDAFVAKVGSPSLLCDTYTLPETGGTINFSLHAGSPQALRNYILLGSISGFEPGLPLPGGWEILPITWDLFTEFALNLINSSLFYNFLGTLDSSGNASAQINSPSLPGFSGITMYYAYALNDPWDFASNPVAIEIVP